jgi:hypothetical protein
MFKSTVQRKLNELYSNVIILWRTIMAAPGTVEFVERSLWRLKLVKTHNDMGAIDGISHSFNKV